MQIGRHPPSELNVLRMGISASRQRYRTETTVSTHIRVSKWRDSRAEFNHRTATGRVNSLPDYSPEHFEARNLVVANRTLDPTMAVCCLVLSKSHRSSASTRPFKRSLSALPGLQCSRQGSRRQRPNATAAGELDRLQRHCLHPS